MQWTTISQCTTKQTCARVRVHISAAPQAAAGLHSHAIFVKKAHGDARGHAHRYVPQHKALRRQQPRQRSLLHLQQHMHNEVGICELLLSGESADRGNNDSVT
jgi:hypothetical protein